VPTTGGGVDTTPPTGSFTIPQGGSTILKPRAYLKVIASDDQSGVAGVTFSVFYNGAWHPLGTGTATDGGWYFIWPTNNISDQTVQVRAEIIDNAENTQTIEVANITLATTFTLGNGFQARGGETDPEIGVIAGTETVAGAETPTQAKSPSTWYVNLYRIWTRNWYLFRKYQPR
jgi:hypothetical protein